MAAIIAHVLVPTARGIILCQRTAMENGRSNVFPLYWDIPGGLTWPNELPRDAAVRECREEIGLSVTINRIIAEDSQLDCQQHAVFTRLVYLANPVTLTTPVKLDHQEHRQVAFWQGAAAWPQERVLVPYVGQALAILVQNRISF